MYIYTVPHSIIEILRADDLKAYASILEGTRTLKLHAKSYIYENMAIFPAGILKVSSDYQSKFKTIELKGARGKARFGAEN